VQLTVEVDSVNLNHLALIESIEIRRDSSESISTATVAFKVVSRDLPRYGISRYGQAHYAFGPRQWQEIVIKDESDNRIFGGYIIDVKREPADNSKFSYVCTCSDYAVKLTRTVIDETYENETDEDIILAAFASQDAVTVEAANIALLVSDMGTFAAKDLNLRQVLDNICELSGGSWHVDPDGYLHYYAAGTTAAPFNLSDQPDNVTSFGFRMSTYSEESASLANRITVLAGFDSNGDEISAIANNLESQGRYGIFSDTVVRREIEDQATADLLASAELSQRAFPRKTGAAVVIGHDGLNVGQTINVRSALYGVNTSFLIQSVTIRQLKSSLTEYTVGFGDKVPTELAVLKRLLNKPKQSTTTVVARPAPSSITVTNFASTIEPVRIVNSLPALPDAEYSDNAVVLLTTDRKIYRRSGNTWTAVVETIDLSGQITETQIADDSISTPKLQALVVTAEKMAANSVIAGKIAADAVIAGTVAAGAIRASDAAFENGAIQTADIGDLQVTNVKVASGLSATKVTTGTLDALVVNVINLNASNINTGTMAANRIGAGTITASVSLTSPSLTITSGGTTINIDSGNYVKLTTSGTSTIVALEPAGVSVRDTSGSARSDITKGQLTTINTFGTVGTFGPGGVTLAGNQIITTRQTAVANPVGGGTIDVQCRASLVDLLNKLRTHGLIS
jgi:hypothetical protein